MCRIFCSAPLFCWFALFVFGSGIQIAEAQRMGLGNARGGKSTGTPPIQRNAPPSNVNWVPTWSDEFNGNALDTSKWIPSFTNNPTNNSLHAYRPSQVSVSNGSLVITSENKPTGGLPYLSGLVTSTNRQHYGRFEVRGDLPTSRGMWPAIWLLPDTQQFPWPSQGEIDIMENRGDEPFTTSSAFHWGTNPPYQHNFLYQENELINRSGMTDYHADFHVYAAEWDADQIRYYVDDVHHYTVFNASTEGFVTNQTAPMAMILNTAVGGDFLSNPDETTVWPQQFLVDYVRVFERAAGPYQLSFENGSFEDNGGSMAHWSLFGNRLPNLATGNAYVSDGLESLKLFGQFDGTVNYSGVQQGLTVTAGQTIAASIDRFIPANDSIAGTGNELVFKFDYYSKPHAAYGSANYLGSFSKVIANGSSANNDWFNQVMTAVVPSGAVEARVAVVFKQNEYDGGSVFVDNIDFRVLPGVTVPLGRKLLDGSAISGQLANVNTGDDSYYQLIPSPTSNPRKQKIEAVLISVSDNDNPSGLGFRLESAMTGGPAGDVIQSIRLWDHQTDQWELLDSLAVANRDTVYEVTATGDVSRFIHPINGELRAKVTWQSPVFAGSTFNWDVKVDHAIWMIEP